jgi:hypothetical protein
MPFCLLYLPPKLVCIHQNFLHRVYTNLNSSFLEWRLGCKTCIVYTGLKTLLVNSKLLLVKISQWKYQCDGFIAILTWTANHEYDICMITSNSSWAINQVIKSLLTLQVVLWLVNTTHHKNLSSDLKKKFSIRVVQENEQLTRIPLTMIEYRLQVITQRLNFMMAWIVVETTLSHYL